MFEYYIPTKQIICCIVCYILLKLKYSLKGLHIATIQKSNSLLHFSDIVLDSKKRKPSFAFLMSWTQTLNKPMFTSAAALFSVFTAMIWVVFSCILIYYCKKRKQCLCVCHKIDYLNPKRTRLINCSW